MTRNEVVKFLNEECNCLKKELSTIKDMISAGKECGYTIIKKGVDEFSIFETCAITDFRKPLLIHREMPSLPNTEAYNGVPVALLLDQLWMGGDYFDSEVWCYLANCEDGDIISSEFLDDPRNIKGFDVMSAGGFIQETETNIEFYLYPQSALHKKLPNMNRNHYRYSESIRMTPVIK